MSNIEISGAKILVRFGSVVITETVVNTWLIMLVIFIACRILTRGLTVRGGTKRQMVAEWIVTKVNGLVKTNMGEAFRDYPPLIAAIMALSALCSLSSMVGLYAPTSDLSTLVGWSLMVFVLITYYKIRANGFLGYLKGYTEPIRTATFGFSVRRAHQLHHSPNLRFLMNLLTFCREGGTRTHDHGYPKAIKDVAG